MAMREHRADHYGAAPIVHNLLIAAPAAERAGIIGPVRAMVAGAAPPAAMIDGMKKIGIDLTHTYGPVSYTHLTLPTSDLVEISVVAVSLKKKTSTHTNSRTTLK